VDSDAFRKLRRKDEETGDGGFLGAVAGATWLRLTAVFGSPNPLQLRVFEGHTGQKPVKIGISPIKTQENCGKPEFFH
jgi:hypothetical protein